MLGDHHLCGQLTGEIMSARPGLKHGIPAPKRLPPKRARPGEFAIFQHILIAAPDVVYQDVQPPLLIRDSTKCRLDLLIIAVIAFNGAPFTGEVLHVFDRAARDINRCARLNEFQGNTFPDSATGPGDKSNFSIYLLHKNIPSKSTNASMVQRTELSVRFVVIMSLPYFDKPLVF